MKIIHTDKAPAAVGPYSQAIEVNGMLYLSGQIAIDPSVGKIIATDIEGQAEQCCKNVEAVLAVNPDIVFCADQETAQQFLDKQDQYLKNNAGGEQNG